MTHTPGAPLVTVVCLTFRHAPYIAQALDSFLAQQTSFRFQVFVGEDCGGDGTAEIVRDYAERYPDQIFAFIRETNMGAQRNLIDLCQQAGTPYIAFCEGDDYWTDPLKLQKQVDHMEAHPQHAACFHNTEIQSDDDWYLRDYYVPDEEGRRLIPASIPRYDASARELRMGYYIRFGPAHTSSMFFRWNYDLVVPDWYYTTVFGDHPILMMQVGDGVLGFLPDVMSVYRRHAGGAIMSQSERDHHLRTREDWLVVLEGLQVHFAERYGDYARTDLEARMVTEMRNYLSHAAHASNGEATGVIERHPRAFSMMMSDYAGTSRLRYRMIGRLYGSDAAGLGAGALEPALRSLPSEALIRQRDDRRRARDRTFKVAGVKAKEPGLWLFLCDDKVSYEGSVRAVFEYLIRHPGIAKPVWLTRSESTYRLLRSEGLPTEQLATKRSRSLLEKAEVLFCQSLRSDIFEVRGFNPGLRIVRLLDNRFFGSGAVMIPQRARTALDQAAAERESGSLRSWRHRSNLVITDSERIEVRLREAGGSGSIVRVASEARLAGVPEPLDPPGARHLLFAPGPHDVAETVAWLLENADDLDVRCAEAGVVIQVFLQNDRAYRGLIKSTVADFDTLTYLETTDVFAHLSHLAGAVCGPVELAFNLLRSGIPVTARVPEHSLVAEDQIFGQRFPGRVLGDWNAAFADALSRVGKVPDPETLARLREEHGVSDLVSPDSGRQVVDAVVQWRKEWR